MQGWVRLDWTERWTVGLEAGSLGWIGLDWIGLDWIEESDGRMDWRQADEIHMGQAGVDLIRWEAAGGLHWREPLFINLDTFTLVFLPSFFLVCFVIDFAGLPLQNSPPALVAYRSEDQSLPRLGDRSGAIM